MVLRPAKGRHPRELAVELTLQNVGKEPIRVDGLWSIFFKWEVAFHRDGNWHWVLPVESETFDHADGKEFASRFVSIEPGEAVTRELELSRSVRQYVTAHSDTHRVSGYEAIVRYEPPDDVRSVQVRARYGQTFNDPGAFWLYSGHTPEEVGVWTGESESEWITMELRE